MKFIPAKSIMSGYSDKNSWFGINYNMNIYKGCCHGCIYCDSRSECYRVDNFDEVRAKENALSLIDGELRSKRRTGVVGTGSMSDPYNPFEKDYLLTRGALELINKYGFGISIATKSDLITRDIDILKSIQKHSPVLLKITITAFDHKLCEMVEPNVAISSQRFNAIKTLSDNGLFAGILMMPVLPFIEDNEENIINIIKSAHDSGAKFIYPAFGMTLRQNQRDWYFKQLDMKFPGLKQKYIKSFGNSYECYSPYAKTLIAIFQKYCREYNILYKMSDIIDGYRKGYEDKQISLFDL